MIYIDYKNYPLELSSSQYYFTVERDIEARNNDIKMIGNSVLSWYLPIHYIWRNKTEYKRPEYNFPFWILIK